MGTVKLSPGKRGECGITASMPAADSAVYVGVVSSTTLSHTADATSDELYRTSTVRFSWFVVDVENHPVDTVWAQSPRPVDEEVLHDTLVEPGAPVTASTTERPLVRTLARPLASLRAYATRRLLLSAYNRAVRSFADTVAARSRSLEKDRVGEYVLPCTATCTLSLEPGDAVTRKPKLRVYDHVEVSFDTHEPFASAVVTSANPAVVPCF